MFCNGASQRPEGGFDGMESMDLRRTYVLIRKYLKDIKDKGREGWEGDKRWPRRNLGTSKT